MGVFVFRSGVSNRRKLGKNVESAYAEFVNGKNLWITADDERKLPEAEKAMGDADRKFFVKKLCASQNVTCVWTLGSV